MPVKRPGLQSFHLLAVSRGFPHPFLGFDNLMEQFPELRTVLSFLIPIDIKGDDSGANDWKRCLQQGMGRAEDSLSSPDTFAVPQPRSPPHPSPRTLMAVAFCRHDGLNRWLLVMKSIFSAPPLPAGEELGLKFLPSNHSVGPSSSQSLFSKNNINSGVIERGLL